ncbi:MAG: decaprenyl-phosphate phosphoribosyltransferase [Acidimicrobiales bacterium]|nr:decaprenyl-phosphate phosphoribosyltransferase [Acidimicrobiales bacterium]
MGEELTVARRDEPVVDLRDTDVAGQAVDHDLGAVARGLVRATRPKQWAKNVLVLAAPGAAGVLTHGGVIVDTALALVSFCLVASSTYLLNDARDMESDRLHPTKRHRPIAAGVVSVRLALIAALVLAVAGFGVGAVVGWRFLVVLAVYLAMTVSYNLGLKHVAVIDIAVVASGYIIRAIAGGVAADVPISQWFLIVASFGSLFMVAGKRHGEHLDLGPSGEEVRPTLGAYPISYLRYVWMVSSGVAITAYCLWAFEMAHTRHGFPWYELSIAPFVLAILRYALLLEYGDGSAPEEIVLGDRTLLVLGALWAAVFGAAVYLGR